MKCVGVETSRATSLPSTNKQINESTPQTMKTRRIFHPLFFLALLLVAGGTFTSCVKQKNCKTTKRTFCIEGELHYVSDSVAYLTEEHLTDTFHTYYDLVPSDIPQKYHKDGVMVRVSLLNQGIQLDVYTGVPHPYRVKCIESLE